MLIEKDNSRKNNLNFIKGILMICVNFIIIIFLRGIIFILPFVCRSCMGMNAHCHI